MPQSLPAHPRRRPRWIAPPSTSVRRASALLCSSLATLLFVGCGGGSGGNFVADLTIPASTPVACSPPTTSPTNSGTGPAITPASATLAMYPGQTLTFPVAIAAAPGGAVQTVSVGASSLPAGLTIHQVLSHTGATAILTLTASTTVATNCFTGVTNGVDDVVLPLILEARSGTGDTQVPIALTVVLENPAFSPAAMDLPVLSIATAGSVAVTSTNTYVPTSVTIADTAMPTNNYSGAGEIKGHGNSTWLMPKKPYKIKLNSKASILGMKPAKNWILLANYDDKTMLRTSLAFHISEILGMFWTPSTRFAEVFLNGSYEGTYQVSEDVEIDPNRLDIAEVSATSNSGEALTGSYLLEIDHYGNETFMTSSPRGLPIGAQDPNPPTAAQETYLTATIAAAENALYSPTYTNPSSGWPAYFDQASAVNWYLVEELTGNQDADFWSSDFFYKLQNDQHLYMGRSGTSTSAPATSMNPRPSIPLSTGCASRRSGTSNSSTIPPFSLPSRLGGPPSVPS